MVEFHEKNVTNVTHEQDKCLPPVDILVLEKVDEQEERETVPGHVSEQRPPGQMQEFFAKNSTHANDEQDVEHGWPNNRAYAHVAVSNEDTDDTGEELRSTAASGHKSGPCHIFRDSKPFGDNCQGRDEKLIAHDR